MKCLWILQNPSLNILKLLFRNIFNVLFCQYKFFTCLKRIYIHDRLDFAGEVTGFAPRLDEFSTPLTEVKIHSKLRRLNKGTRYISFEHKTPADIIRDIVQGYNLKADVENFGPEYNYIEQKNFTDYGYIMYLAGKYGKSVYCHGDMVYVKTEITPTDDNVVLEYGKSMVSARTRTDLAGQLSAVTATGWDIMKCGGFTATATMKDLPLKIGGEYCWEDNAKGYDPHKVEQLSSGSFTDEKDALEVAKSVLLGRSLQFQSCDAKTEGSGHIRPGNRLTVKYLGKHSDGEYLVQSVEHSLSVQDGYFTTCHLIRNFCEVGGNNRNISAIDRERIDSRSTESEASIASAGSGNQTETQTDTEESNVEENNPTITNPHWENADGNVIKKALVGDEVCLCADVTDIADGASAKIKIVEKDNDGNDDFVTKLSTSVNDGKIRCKWKVIYTEDNDDTDSQQELEEKGYTLPEYAFTVDCDGTESEESRQLDVMGWIKKQLKDIKTGTILSNTKYTIYLLDGSEIKGISDNDGILYLDNLKIGKYFISIGV